MPDLRPVVEHKMPGKTLFHCYQCYVTLDAMRFYAKSGQEKSYQAVRARTLQKLEELLGKNM